MTQWTANYDWLRHGLSGCIFVCFVGVAVVLTISSTQCIWCKLVLGHWSICNLRSGGSPLHFSPLSSLLHSSPILFPSLCLLSFLFLCPLFPSTSFQGEYPDSSLKGKGSFPFPLKWGVQVYSLESFWNYTLLLLRFSAFSGERILVTCQGIFNEPSSQETQFLVCCRWFYLKVFWLTG